MIEDSKENRRLIGKYIDVYEYPDGRIELRDTLMEAIPYVTYVRLPEVAQGTIVENKRLGHVLQIAQLVQEQRDNRRGRSAPASWDAMLVNQRARHSVQLKQNASTETAVVTPGAVIQAAPRKRGRPRKNEVVAKFN